MGKQWKQWQSLFWGGSKITADGDWNHEIKRRLLLGRKAITNLDSILKSRDITLPTKVHLVKDVVFPVVMLWMWGLDYKESWVLESWCFWTMVLEKTLESSLGCKEIKPINPKGNQSWMFIGRTDADDHKRGSLSSPSYLVRNLILAPQLEKTHAYLTKDSYPEYFFS